jgi:hypothetical protein
MFMRANLQEKVEIATGDSWGLLSGGLRGQADGQGDARGVFLPAQAGREAGLMTAAFAKRGSGVTKWGIFAFRAFFSNLPSFFAQIPVILQPYFDPPDRRPKAHH